MEEKNGIWVYFLQNHCIYCKHKRWYYEATIRGATKKHTKWEGFDGRNAEKIWTCRSCGSGSDAVGLFLWKQGDGRIIDGLGPNGIAARVVDVTRGVVRLQTGYVYHYAFVMLIGVAGLISWYLMSGLPKGAH